jgi:hypothetical protein
VNALGLYDLDRRIRPVGEAYKKIVHEWGDVLPTQSVCLRVPVYRPSETRWALSQRSAAPTSTPPPAQPEVPTTPANSDGGR